LRKEWLCYFLGVISAIGLLAIPAGYMVYQDGKFWNEPSWVFHGKVVLLVGLLFVVGPLLYILWETSVEEDEGND